MKELKNSRRDSCTACTFLRSGVKTRKSIPHRCGKSSNEIISMMKIIKLGTIKPVNEDKIKTCYKCKTIFSYSPSDVQPDRDGSYVVCPNEDCKSFNNT